MCRPRIRFRTEFIKFQLWAENVRKRLFSSMYVFKMYVLLPTNWNKSTIHFPHETLENALKVPTIMCKALNLNKFYAITKAKKFKETNWKNKYFNGTQNSNIIIIILQKFLGSSLFFLFSVLLVSWWTRFHFICRALFLVCIVRSEPKSNLCFVGMENMTKDGCT